MRDASADAGGNVDYNPRPNPNQQVWLREGWGDCAGLFGTGRAFRDAVLWMGRRFYERHDLHLRDEGYWNNSGDGVGIEHIDLGGARLAYAYIQHDVGNLAAFDARGASAFPGFNNTAGRSTVVGSHDLRLSDFPLWAGSTLVLGVQYNNVSSGTGVLAVNGTGLANYHNKGIQWSAELTQTQVLGGDNRIYATWGNGNTFWNWYNPEVTTHSTWFEVMDVVLLKLARNLEAEGTAIWRKQEGADANQLNSNVWHSLGVRPVWFFSKHLSLAAEVGFDRLKYEGEPDSRHLLKETLALQFSPEASFWSRPSLRFFVTRAQWNANASAHGLYPIGAGQFGPDTHGLTFGAQLEAWW